MLEIEDIVARELGVPRNKLGDDVGYQSIAEWDSLRHVALMIALEAEFGIEITDELMLQLRSVRAIRDFFQTDTAGSSAGASEASRARPDPDPAGATVHRGLEGVYVDRTAITHIDGEHGVLEYRGYNIHDLVQRSSFEETTWLLLYGDLPDGPSLASFEDELRRGRELPPAVINILGALDRAHPVEALRTGVSALGALTTAPGDETADAALRAGIRLVAQIPTLIATHHALRCGRPVMPPQTTGSHAWNFLYMLLGHEPSAQAVRFVDRDLIVHADHDANASTFGARITIGCRANLHAAITSAIAAFSGSVHGGAVERVTEVIDTVGTPAAAAAYVQARWSNNQPVMGFGHRVYRTEDPRVRPLRSITRDLGRERGDMRGFQIIEALVQAMEPYARHGVGPNVDLYAGLAYRLLGLPDDLAVAMFVAGRIAGWVAQALEQHRNNVLIRPRMQYVGATGRCYRPLGERESAA